ncbi:PREDICTED: uncharacterized protein LOC106118830 [Papilio xuthus]|uniref:Uncharacterized protein LOC106118830 n=1 Tax=Papilio xuthus TaxID=66420 RepID=A0AAJ7EA77_PAPXU|nr:PREDICTED: uncharacterized protein LOC106118830 [Papilio xuthus]
MSLNTMLILFIIFHCTSLLESKEYRYDYKYIDEINGWIKIHLFPAKWQEARLRCQFEGAALASPETLELALTLRSIASEFFPCGVFTGVHATFSPGDYFSVEGTPIARMPIKWAPNEPDNYEGKEDCIILQGNGTAADVKCTELYPYVCYRSRVKNPVILNECGTVDPGYSYEARTGSCYKFHNVGRTWSRAFMACAAEGGYLTIVNSNVEATVLAEIFAKHPESQIMATIRHVLHIGFHSWGEIGDWKTIHGQPIEAAGYSKFENGQPDSPHVTMCGGMFKSGGLDDFSCEHTAPFICEKSPDSLYENTKRLG